MREKELKKGFDLDEIEMKWEDEDFPEDRLLGTLPFNGTRRKI